MKGLRYGDTKPLVIRRVIFVLLIIAAAIIQNTGKISGGAFTVRAFLILPLIVSISMFEREVASAVFGAFAGVLWDVSAGVDGYNAFVIMLLCTACSLFISHFMRNSIITAFVLGVSVVAIYEVLYIIVFIVLQGGGNPIAAAFGFYLPSLIFTSAFIPIFYYIVKAVFLKQQRIKE